MTLEELIERMDVEKALEAHAQVGRLLKDMSYRPPETLPGTLEAIAHYMRHMASALAIDADTHRIVRALTSAIADAALQARQGVGREVRIRVPMGEDAAPGLETIFYEAIASTGPMVEFEGDSRMFLPHLIRALRAEAPPSRSEE